MKCIVYDSEYKTPEGVNAYITPLYSETLKNSPECLFITIMLCILPFIYVIFSFIRKWNVRDCDPLIELLETWMPMLPPWVFENIQDQLVLPRLLQEVENWNPLTDTMPIHSWLHPWLPLMGKNITDI